MNSTQPLVYIIINDMYIRGFYFYMTEEQKEYIEVNIDLIQKCEWEEFFNDSTPSGLGSLLHEAGINFLKELSYIPRAAFSETDIRTFDIPSNVRYIGRYAFAWCSELTSITIPDSVTSIGNSAFWSCSNLTSITIPNSVVDIQYDAFGRCNKLEINYGGTTEDWEKLVGYDHRIFRYTPYTCNCVDGVVKK